MFHAKITCDEEKNLWPIPTFIRAYAQVICDTDASQLNEIRHPVTGDPIRRSVVELSHAIGYPLRTHREFRQFDAAYAAYTQRIRNTRSSLGGLGEFSEFSSLSLAIDRECGLSSVSLNKDLDSVMRLHELLLRQPMISSTPMPCHIPLRRLCACAIEKMLSILSCLHSLSNRGSPSNEIFLSLTELKPNVKDEHTKTHDGDFFLANTTRAQNSFTNETNIEMQIAKLNAHLYHIVEELDWVFTVLGAAAPREAASRRRFSRCDWPGQSMNVGDYIADVFALEAWNDQVGSGIPLCTVEVFERFLYLFPEWARTAILFAIDPASTGVVTVRSLHKLITRWGPFLLLSRNMAWDLSSKFFELTLTPAELAVRMSRDNPEPGTFVVALTETDASFEVLFITPDGELHTTLLYLNCGLWTLRLAQEREWQCETDPEGWRMFETPSAVCRAFEDIFIHPAGSLCGAPELSEEEFTMENTAREMFSAMHRSCFNGNAAFLSHLLESGSSLLVNSAMREPFIPGCLTWTPLLCAVNTPSGDPHRIVVMLLDAGADPYYADESGSTALYYAIINRYIKTLQLLISVHKRDKHQLRSSNTTIPLLLALGAHRYNLSPQENTRLRFCIPDHQIIELLLNEVTDWNVVSIAIHVLEAKRHGYDITSAERNAQIESGKLLELKGVEISLLSESEAQEEDDAIKGHTELCQSYPSNINRSLSALYNCSCWFSIQQLSV